MTEQLAQETQVEQEYQEQPAPAAPTLASELPEDVRQYIAGLEAQLDQRTPPEMGGVAWVDIYGTKSDESGQRHKVKISLTARAVNAIQALDELVAAIAHAEKQYKLKPYDPTLSIGEAPKPASTTPAPAKAQVPAPAGQPAPAKAPAPIPAPAPAPVPAQAAAPADGGVIEVVKVTVTPRADGKSQVAFWAQGRKFADLTAYRTPDQFASDFSIATGAEWTAAHFQVATEYPIRLRLTWAKGKPNQSGTGFYKDIVSMVAF